jgi:cytochrome c556
MNFIDKIAKNAGIALLCILFGSSSIIAMNQEDAKKTTFIKDYLTLNSDLEQFLVVETQYMEEKRAVEAKANQLDKEAGKLVKTRAKLHSKNTKELPLDQQMQQFADSANSFMTRYSFEVSQKLDALEPRKEALREERARLKAEYARLREKQEILKDNAVVVLFMNLKNIRANDAIVRHENKLL